LLLSQARSCKLQVTGDHNSFIRQSNKQLWLTDQHLICFVLNTPRRPCTSQLVKRSHNRLLVACATAAASAMCPPAACYRSDRVSDEPAAYIFTKMEATIFKRWCPPNYHTIRCHNSSLVIQLCNYLFTASATATSAWADSSLLPDVHRQCCILQTTEVWSVNEHNFGKQQC
jgi:hypothetical protein